MKRLSLYIMSLVLFLGTVNGVNAVSQVVFNGEKESFIVSPSDLDLFQNFKGLLPGGTYTQEITIGNESNDPVDIYFKMYPLDDVYEKISKYMTMKIEINNKPVYDENLGEIDKFKENTKLFSLEAETAETMLVTLNIATEMSNEFSNSYTELDWYFYLEKSKDHGETVPPQKPYKPIIKLPSTGQGSMILFFYLLALGGIVIVIYEKSKNDR